MLYSTAFIDLTFYTKAICLNPCKVSGAPVVQPGRKRLQPRHYSALPSDLESGSHCRSVRACDSSIVRHCGKIYRRGRWKCETGKCGTGKFGNRKRMERRVWH